MFNMRPFFVILLLTTLANSVDIRSFSNDIETGSFLFMQVFSTMEQEAVAPPSLLVLLRPRGTLATTTPYPSRTYN